jgi:hypothetical protein
MSNAIPKTYKGTATRISQCNGMLATIHSAVNATNMFTSCPNTRIQLPSLELKRVTRLTSNNAPSPYINTGSRCSIKRLFICWALIILKPQSFSTPGFSSAFFSGVGILPSR